MSIPVHLRALSRPSYTHTHTHTNNLSCGEHFILVRCVFMSHCCSYHTVDRIHWISTIVKHFLYPVTIVTKMHNCCAFWDMRVMEDYKHQPVIELSPKTGWFEGPLSVMMTVKNMCSQLNESDLSAVSCGHMILLQVRETWPSWPLGWSGGGAGWIFLFLIQVWTVRSWTYVSWQTAFYQCVTLCCLQVPEVLTSEFWQDTLRKFKHVFAESAESESISTCGSKVTCSSANQFLFCVCILGQDQQSS